MLTTNQQRAVYIISDLLSVGLGWFAFNMLRYMWIPEGDFASLTHFMTTPSVLTGQILFPLMICAMYMISGFYSNVFYKSRVDTVLNTIAVSFISTLIIYFAVLINDGVAERLKEYELICLLWAFLMFPTIVVRMLITSHTTRQIRRGKLLFNTLIVGTTRGAVNTAHKLDSLPRSIGMNIVGYVHPINGQSTRHLTDLDRPAYSIDTIEQVCRDLNIKNLIVAPHPDGMKATIDTINKLYTLDLPVYITPELYQTLFSLARVTSIIGEPLINVSQASIPDTTRNLKRLSDIAVSALTLLVISPMLLVIALVIKRDSKGPVIYRQERIGLHKRPFYILKFRSMYTDAESGGPMLSTLNDPRITPVGRFLRKYRLDELPQFWNVLKGDMSLVGPRPERDYYVQKIIKVAPNYTLLHQVRPGITSWGMVKYGYASDVSQMVERLKYDLVYLDSVSLGVDLKILFYTVSTVLTGKGI